MTLDLNDSLQTFVDSESSQRGFVSGNDFVLDLLQKERDRAHVRGLIKEGESLPATQINVASYIASQRDRFNASKDH